MVLVGGPNSTVTADLMSSKERHLIEIDTAPLKPPSSSAPCLRPREHGCGESIATIWVIVQLRMKALAGHSYVLAAGRGCSSAPAAIGARYTASVGAPRLPGDRPSVKPGGAISAAVTAALPMLNGTADIVPDKRS
jgi:hypothetical protein